MGAFDRYGVDEDLVARAQQRLGGAPPPPAPPPAFGGGANTLQPLSPEEQAIGAQLAGQQTPDQAAAAAGFTHADTGPLAQVRPQAGTPGLDWQPPEQTAPYVDVTRNAPGMAAGAPPAPSPRIMGRGARAFAGKSPYTQIANEAHGAAADAQGQVLAGEDQYTGGMQSQREAVGELANVKGQQGEAVAKSAAKDAEGLSAYQQQLQADYDAHTRAVSKTEQESKDLANEIKNTKVKDSRGVGKRVMGAIAVALSGLGDAYAATGGKHTNYAQTAVGIINQGIDRDLDMQQKMLDNKRTALAAKNSELAWARQKLGDTMEARNLAKAAMIDQHARELAAQLGSTATPEAQAIGKQVIGQLDAQQGEHQAEVNRTLLERNQATERQAVLAEDQRRRAAAAAAAGAPLRTAKAIADIEKTQAETAKLRGEAAGGGAELPGYVPTQKLGPGDQTKAREIHAAAASLKADYARLDAIRRRNRGGTWNREDVTEAQQIINGMAPKYSNLYGSGAPSETEFKNFRETIIDPTSYQMTGRDPSELYRRGAAQIDAITRAQLGSYGYRPAQQGPAPESLVRPGAAR